MSPTLHIRHFAQADGKDQILLTLQRPGRANLEANATIEFALSQQEQKDLRWYLEDYLQRAESVEPIAVEQVEKLMRSRGEELYKGVLLDNQGTQAIWFAIREQLAELRIEIATGIAEAASIPWELMRDPQSDSAIALRVRSFVRVQSNANVGFVPVPATEDGRIRLLYVISRPSGINDVSLRAVANRLLQDLGEHRARFDITVLRPPTYEQLQLALTDAKESGRPYHIMHFDGHGIYADLSQSKLADWSKCLSTVALGSATADSGKHGYLLFEHPSDDKMRPVTGDELGMLLHDTGVPVLVLNACQSAMHEEKERPADADDVHDEVRAIGSLAQAVVDQGIPAVLGMRYSIFVVTASQYIGQLYTSLAKGRSFGQAATEARKHLFRNPDRWVGLQRRPLQDWFVPVVYEAGLLELPTGQVDDIELVSRQSKLDPVQENVTLRRYVPDHGFVGRDETLLLLDRAFDDHSIVLLHAYAGQGKTATAVEFASWYAQTGGLTLSTWPQPVVLFKSFEQHCDLIDLLNQIGQQFAPLLASNGVEWHAINDNAERHNLVLQILRRVPVFWIWDNVELVDGAPAGADSAWTRDEREELADFLKQVKLDAATKAKILLTSRRDECRWLRGIPYRIRMPRMSTTDSARLALRLGDEKGVTREAVARWQPLLDYCQGNPMTVCVLVNQAINENRRNEDDITQFVDSIRRGERDIQDEDEAQGHDKSLWASLNYGFRNAITQHDLPIIALLHLFQGAVDVRALHIMGHLRAYGDEGQHSIVNPPSLRGRNEEELESLLRRAADVGLLTHLGSRWFTIHPALPWFLGKVFEQYYPSDDNCRIRENGERHFSSADALYAWVAAIGVLSHLCVKSYLEGRSDLVRFLELEESNLLRARVLARRFKLWTSLIHVMHGLRELYQHLGRNFEWARLVDEIADDFCSAAGDPVSGREEQYHLVLEYRIEVERDLRRDFVRAKSLQTKLIEWNQLKATEALALGDNVLLDDKQRNLIQTLAVSVGTMGQILRRQGDAQCISHYEKAASYCNLIGDTVGAARDYHNLGLAHMDIPEVRDLDASEEAILRSIELDNPNDLMARCSNVKLLGKVRHERLKDRFADHAPSDELECHFRVAADRYLEALDLCPPSAVGERGEVHYLLGSLYTLAGQTEQSRVHLELAMQCFEQTGDRHSAAGTRYMMALMYYRRSVASQTTGQQRDLLLRAQDYAEAALRDLQHYQSGVADDEVKTRRVVELIRQSLDELPL